MDFIISSLLQKFLGIMKCYSTPSDVTFCFFSFCYMFFVSKVYRYWPLKKRFLGIIKNNILHMASALAFKSDNQPF